MISKRYNPDLTKLSGIENVVEKLGITEDISTASRRTKQKIVEYILYGLKDQDEEYVDI